ncbi:aminotransferase class V-fold PLP-dependent enzyme [Clostridiaceae bacterium DONG20-135]|uniref:Aminotransferase class V-fold PLP-dependent enzyme n=1 Tax=Copranaerobaculum intestinale TaxID=2692629 RepID=A0A6N8U475_9FIRM|nr:aminotransferase class V-fold PLP-dependent enzyme [Copranaerobaculum intestinale]MXQ72976.1 aminotransferase class V-fold PLP-dependent enzyme [Copranaerobaculum intestinale]
MLNFTVGPVTSDESIQKVGYEQVPYFRTPEFSEIMLENERLIKKYAYASEDSRAVFLTGSGTAAMEAAVMNTLSEADKVLIINGGSFGQRFCDLCQLHQIPFTELTIPYGRRLTEERLSAFENMGYTALLVNMHETSTGVLYDMEMLSNFCRKNHLFFIVDAISSFLADPINMDEQKIDVLITGSQKALACPPGVSVLVLSKRAQKRIEVIESKSFYLDLKSALKNAERGQTPFTPAVGILRQIHTRLKNIEMNGGVDSEIARTQKLAEDFRSKIENLPFEIFSESLSNAVTPLHPLTASATNIFKVLKDEYQIWVCPNGGDLSEKVFRIGHLGALNEKDNQTLINAFLDMQKRKII